jgi:hypothetical protein
LCSFTGQVSDAVGVPPQSRGGICSAMTRLPHVESQIGAIARTNSGFLLSPFLISHLGRAPPSELPHL